MRSSIGREGQDLIAPAGYEKLIQASAEHGGMLNDGRHVFPYGRVEKGAQLLPEIRRDAWGEGLEVRGPKFLFSRQ